MAVAESRVVKCLFSINNKNNGKRSVDAILVALLLTLSSYKTPETFVKYCMLLVMIAD